MMKDQYLDDLVANGTLHSYYYCNIDENGNEDTVSECKNADRLVLRFPNGKYLKIDTICTGINENTKMIIYR